jgi:hypothetical protein
MISPDARQYSPLSGGKSTYRSVQFSRASSVFAGWLPCGYGSRSTIAARSPFFPGIWTRWMPAPVEDALGIAGAARHIKDRACAARVPSQRVTFAGSGVTIYKRGLTATGKSIF